MDFASHVVPQFARRFFRQISDVMATTDPACSIEYLKNIAIELPNIARARSLSPADARMTGRDWRFHLLGTTVTIGGDNFGSARELYARKVYFAAPGFGIQPGDVVVDLGANRGVFTTLAACTAARVVAVEAQHEFRNDIIANLRANHCEDKAELEFALISPGTGMFASDETLRNSSHFRERPPELSVNELFRRHHLERVDFMKIDIEGSEYDLFARELEWLPRVRKLAMEVHVQFGDIDALKAILERNGFHAALRDNDQREVPHLQTDGYLFAQRLN